MGLRILHERWKCIACNACAAIAPEQWTMETADGKSHLIGSRSGKVAEGPVEELRLPDESVAAQNEEAAAICPVQCIHVARE